MFFPGRSCGLRVCVCAQLTLVKHAVVVLPMLLLRTESTSCPLGLTLRYLKFCVLGAQYEELKELRRQSLALQNTHAQLSIGGVSAASSHYYPGVSSPQFQPPAEVAKHVDQTPAPATAKTVSIQHLGTGFGIGVVGPTVEEPRTGCFIARSSRDGVAIGQRAACWAPLFIVSRQDSKSTAHVGAHTHTCQNPLLCINQLPCHPNAACMRACLCIRLCPTGDRIVSINGIDASNWHQEVPCA